MISMPTLKRRVANVLEQMTGNLIIPPNEVHLGPERVHLRRFFSHFGVDCVFDVGANSGQYAKMLRNVIGFTGDIVSFEPIPEVAADLAREASGDPRWYVATLALDRESGPAQFNVMPESQFSSLRRPSDDQPDIFRHSNTIARSIDVERSTLAIEVERYRALLAFERPFLKMDTQGNDVAVFEGAGPAVQSFVGLQSELPIKRLYDGSAGLAETLAIYVAQGFELSAFVPNNEGHFPMLVEIDCILYNKSAVPVSVPPSR